MDWRDLSVVQRLELFRDRAEELRQTRFLRNTLAAGYALNIEGKLIPGTGGRYEVTFSISPYDVEDLRSFLTLFRRFFAVHDPCSPRQNCHTVGGSPCAHVPVPAVY